MLPGETVRMYFREAKPSAAMLNAWVDAEKLPSAEVVSPL